MALSDRWRPLDHDAMEAFARAWLSELRDDPGPVGSNIGQAVVLMNFVAPPEQQWGFILAAVAHADTDDELGHIAAGPIEHLLGHHGTDYIGRFEEEAARDPKFARALTGVWRYMMSEEVWRRVKALQARVPDPLDGQGAEPN